MPVRHIECDVRGSDRAAQQRRVHDVREQAVLDEKFAAAPPLRLARCCEVYVDPAGEEVLLVPFALAVAEQDERRHGSQSAGRSARCAKACRLASDSPRLTRQSHSRRIDEAKPSSSNVLNVPSLYSSTLPSTRSISSGVIADNGNRPRR